MEQGNEHQRLNRKSRSQLWSTMLRGHQGEIKIDEIILRWKEREKQKQGEREFVAHQSESYSPNPYLSMNGSSSSALHLKEFKLK